MTALTRFRHREIDPATSVGLRPDHPALAEARTIFPKSVVASEASPRFLISGHSNSKLGKEVTKGERAGWPIYQLTLEERATCSSGCFQWASCYGNAMPFTRRHTPDAAFLPLLRAEIATLARKHRDGFLVRLHVLGDFYSVPYVLAWGEMLRDHPGLHVFGYTARRIDDTDPASAKIAQAIELLRSNFWTRFAIRTSHAEPAPLRTIVVDQDPGLTEVIMCPAQVDSTEACGSCGLCWAPQARSKTIGFFRHGMRARSGPRKITEAASATVERRRGPPKKAERGWRSIPQRMADKVFPELNRLWAAHPDGLSVKAIAADLGMAYPHAYAAVCFMHAGGAVNFANRLDAASKFVLRPGDALPSPDLTGKQARVLDALVRLAGPDGVAVIGFKDLAKAAGDVSWGSVAQIVESLKRKGRLDVVSRGNSRAVGSYRVAEAFRLPVAIALPPPKPVAAPVVPLSEIRIEPRPRAKPRALPVAPPPAPRPVPETLTVPIGAEFSDADRRRFGPLAALRHTECRWPIGEPDEADFAFCGKTRIDDKPYCRAHQDRAHPPAATRNPSRPKAVTA
jgi:hypothetical protein